MNDLESLLMTIVLSDIKNAGTVKELLKDFNIYQKNKQSILLRVLVPKSLIGDQIMTQYFDTSGQMITESGVYTALKMGMVRVDEFGKKTKTDSFYLRFIKEIRTEKGEFYIYERMFPSVFTFVAGTGLNAPKIVFNLVNILNNISVDNDGVIVDEPTIISLFTTQECRVDILPSTNLDQDLPDQPGEMELLQSRVDNLLKNINSKADKDAVIYKYDLKEDLPNGVTFNKDGYKTPNVLFLNAEYDLPNMEYSTDWYVGSVLITNDRQEGETIKQIELFFYDTGVSQRTIEFNQDLSVKTIGDWSIKVDRKQNLSHAGEFLYVDKNGNINFTKALKDLITKSQGELLTEDTSSYDFSSMFNVTAKNKEEVIIDGADELKAVIKEIDFDLANGTFDFERYNGKKFTIQLPTKLSQFENDTKFITKDVDNLKNYTLTDQVGNRLTFLVDPLTYVLTVNLLNPKGEVISAGQVDLPLESMIIDGRYDNGYVYLQLQSGTEIHFSIAALISGLVPTTRKINGKSLTSDIEIFIPENLSDLIEDATHRTVTDTEKTKWNNKVDKVTGKGLSTNDYTTIEKNKLAKAVLFSEQTLTEEEKSQARSNIGAGSSGFSGRFEDLIGTDNVAKKTDLDSCLLKSGGTMTGNINLIAGKSYITNGINAILGDAGSYYFVGHPNSKPLQLRGSGERPTFYNGISNESMVLTKDLNDYWKLDGSKYLSSLTQPASNNNIAGWRHVAEFSIGKWCHISLVLAIAGRHSGNGILTIGVGNSSGSAPPTNPTINIKYYGDNSYPIYKNSWKIIYNKSTGFGNIYWRYADYGSCQIKVLSRRVDVQSTLTTYWNNGEWLTTEPVAGTNEIEVLPIFYNEEYLPLTGGTVTGSVIKSQTNGFGGFKVYNTGYEAGNTPSDQIGLGSFGMFNADGTDWYTSMQSYVYTDGRIGTRFQSRQKIKDSEATYNSAELWLYAGNDTSENKYATLNCNFFPISNNAFDLGRASNRWKNFYAYNVYAGTQITVPAPDSADNSTKVPNTSWVNNAIKKVLDNDIKTANILITQGVSPTTIRLNLATNAGSFIGGTELKLSKNFKAGSNNTLDLGDDINLNKLDCKDITISNSGVKYSVRAIKDVLAVATDTGNNPIWNVRLTEGGSTRFAEAWTTVSRDNASYGSINLTYPVVFKSVDSYMLTVTALDGTWKNWERVGAFGAGKTGVNTGSIYIHDDVAGNKTFQVYIQGEIVG